MASGMRWRRGEEEASSKEWERYRWRNGVIRRKIGGWCEEVFAIFPYLLPAAAIPGHFILNNRVL